MFDVTDGQSLIADADGGASAGVLTGVMTREASIATSRSTVEQALDTLIRERPDLVLMDVNVPQMHSLGTCRHFAHEASTRRLPLMLITGLTAIEGRVRGFDVEGEPTLSKGIAIGELQTRVRSLSRLRDCMEEREFGQAVTLSLALTLEARDPCTGGHSERLARYAVALGAHLGLDQEQRFTLYRGGFLHDIGKLGVPDSVLLKPGALTSGEFAQMRQHTVIGDTLCGEWPSLQAVRPIVRHHHERQDGSGYPDQLRGDEIPFLASVMAVVDGYDAMTTDRPYKSALTPAMACRELREEAGQGWKSEALVEAFVELQQSGGLNRIFAARGC